MKTPEQYKEDFVKRASAGFMLAIFRTHYSSEDGTYYYRDKGYNEGKPSDNPTVRAKDAVWSRESGVEQFHEWPAAEFKALLETKGHVRSYDEALKRRQKRNLKKEKKDPDMKHRRTRSGFSYGKRNTL